MGMDEKRRNRAQLEAERRLEEMGGVVDRYAKCPETKVGGEPCENRAGHLTDHLGAGKCQPHGGNGTFEKLVSQYMLQHAAARSLDITPWEALLRAMRRSAGLAAFYDSKIATVKDDNSLKPGGDDYAWIQGSERAHLAAAKYAKAALDAGVAERIVAGIEAEASILYAVVNKLFEELKLPPEMEEFGRLIIRQQALALSSAGQLVEEYEDDEEHHVIEGDVV